MMQPIGSAEGVLGSEGIKNRRDGDIALLKVSVIIPCYNGAKTIGAQLDALACQQYAGPWEVILADNGSTDETLKIVGNFKCKLPNLRIVDASGRRGQPYAMNVGARAATGEALLFCDADDEVGEGWLAAMADALTKHDFVGCRIDTRKLNPPWLSGRGSSQDQGLRRLPFAPDLYYAGSGTMGVKRPLFLDAGGFDENMYTVFDTLLCVQLQLAGTELHFVPDAVLHVRHRGTLKATFRQGFSYGEYQPLLYKKSVAMGIPKVARPWKDGINYWRSLLARLPRVRNKAMLHSWLFRFGWHLGRIKGSIKHRVLFF